MRFFLRKKFFLVKKKNTKQKSRKIKYLHSMFKYTGKIMTSKIPYNNVPEIPLRYYFEDIPEFSTI